MSSSWLIEEEGDSWAFSYDIGHVPGYVVLTLSGQSTLERNRRVVEVIQEQRARSLLPSGEICPLIVDMFHDNPPPTAVLLSSYALLEPLLPHLSYLVYLVTPEHPDLIRMTLALEAFGLHASPKMDLVHTMEEAVEKVLLYHQWHHPKE